MLDTVCIYKDPYGVVLVMGAWNYPLQLTLLPMAAAIAAGNTVIVKPSEVAPACAKFMAETIPKYLDTVRQYSDFGFLSQYISYYLSIARNAIK